MQNSLLKPQHPRLQLREKLAYGVGDIGSNLVYIPLSTFALFYFTDIAGIGAAMAGGILLAGQLLNGVSDLLIGYLIDRTRTRWGKARPWILGTSIPLAVSLVAMFSVPASLDQTGRAIWALVSYTLVTAVFFTASNVAYSALMSIMTLDAKSRVTLATFRFFAALLTGLVVNIATLPLVTSFGTGQTGWTTTIALYAFLTVAALCTVFFGTRERVIAGEDRENSVRQPTRLLVRSLTHNRFFFLAAALFLLFYLSNTLGSAGGIYLASDVLGDPSLFGLLSAAQLLPPLILIGFMPKFISRYGKRRMFLIGIAVMFVGTAVVLIDPTNAPLVVSSAVVRGIGLVPLTAGIFALVGDVVDYGEWRFGVRTDGLIYSSVVFGQKLGSGVGGALAGALLAAGGYAAGASQQTPEAIQAILAVSFYVPLIAIAAMAIVVWFIRIERYAPEVHAHLEARASSVQVSEER